MTSAKIWLDDLRAPSDGYIWCRSFAEAVEEIEKLEREKTIIEIIDCDYDLSSYGNGRETGLDFLEWLCDRRTFYPVNVHSTHIFGNGIMWEYIDENWNK